MNRDIIDKINTFRAACVMDVDLRDYHTQRIDPLVDRIAALEGVTGKDGRELELKKGKFPDLPETPDTDEYKAVLWRLVPREGETEEWKLLVFIHEITGPQGDPGTPGAKGDKGDKGDPGAALRIRGKVQNVNDLINITSGTLYMAYLVLSTNEVWMTIGTPFTELSNWKNLGQVAGVKGDKGDKGDRGDRGPQGSRGPKGSSGGISSFLLNWIVSTATNQALTAVQLELNDAINDAINIMANQLANLAEDAAEAALSKAMDEMMDQFKGDKGEKGDKGDPGKDGKSVEMVGSYEYLSQFQLEYPANEHNVGKAALIGRDYSPKSLWCIIARPPVAGLVHYTYDELGDIRGPKGEDAQWTVSIRDKDFVQKGKMFEVVSDLPEGVAGLYIQDTDSVVVTGIQGSPGSGEHVGIRMAMKYPIPTLIPTGSALGTPTVNKVLSNDGTRLKWVNPDLADEPKEHILLKSPNNTIFEISVDNNGRLTATEKI